MPLFRYLKDDFQNAFPLFQDKVRRGLFCIFDENDKLVEACYFQESTLLNSFVKYRSVQLKDDRLVEQFGDYVHEWVGHGGVTIHQDKDQNLYEVKWSRESKLKKILCDMLEAYRVSEETGITEVDEDLRRIAEFEQRKEEFDVSRFQKWPSSLSQNRFKTWQDLNPDLTASDFRSFFEVLSEAGKLNSLTEDQLGAELSKWVHVHRDS